MELLLHSQNFSVLCVCEEGGQLKGSLWGTLCAAITWFVCYVWEMLGSDIGSALIIFLNPVEYLRYNKVLFSNYRLFGATWSSYSLVALEGVRTVSRLVCNELPCGPQ